MSWAIRIWSCHSDVLRALRDLFLRSGRERISSLPWGLYIQVPFCQTRCSYCNFHTRVVSGDLFQPYAAAICKEIHLAADRQAGDHLAPFTLNTVYFGGGTPSLLAPALLAQILETLRRRFRFGSSEVTLEADPETITPEKAAAWLAAGFNRISLGVQSFADLELKSSGRLHRRVDIFSATELLRASGFANISMDLIAGLPHQTRDSWEDSVDQLLVLRPEHVSVYMLEIDEGSRLGRESLAGGSRYGAEKIPPDDAIAEFYESACLRLAGAGYEHYEISNWAAPGFHSLHNLKYWRREPYLGLGAGAHSFEGSRRWANVENPAQYVAAMERGVLPREQLEDVSPAQALDEEFFLGLRQLEGIDLARIERDYNVRLRPRLAPLLAKGLVELDGPRLRLARSRLAISNEVFVELLS
jgi:oxygen-independent coproporphyrinogen III oxidase